MAQRDRKLISLDTDDGSAEVWQVPVPARQFARVELLEILQSVGRLPVEQREVLLLAAVEELHYEEIASLLKIPLGTVMSRLSRGRERLRGLMEGRAEPVRLKNSTRSRPQGRNADYISNCLRTIVP
mgnify:CR=1 FL=1